MEIVGSIVDEVHDIARCCDLLVACPGTVAERQRSGTWATIRRARRWRKPIVKVLPGGSVLYERPDLVGVG